MLYSVIESASKALRSRPLLKRMVYDPLKRPLRRRFASFDYTLHYLRNNPEFQVGGGRFKIEDDSRDAVGILMDPCLFHTPYVAACEELGVPYKLVDIFAADWLTQVKQSGCDIFFTWPGETIPEWKRLYDDRLRILVEDLGKTIYPDLKATWLYGSKERQATWLDLNDFPHPQTWVYYDRQSAEQFINKRFTTTLQLQPSTSTQTLVAKTDIGAVASGVTILRNRREALRYIRRTFTSGTPGYYSDAHANQWRHVLFQEYLPDAKEWRVHRIGDRFFGFGKARKGDFHSGSGETNWTVPPTPALDLAYAITEKGHFRSMAVDIFETTDGHYLVNELQCVYGQHGDIQLMCGSTPGCLLHTTNGWEFEPNTLAKCHGSILRVKDAFPMTNQISRDFCPDLTQDQGGTRSRSRQNSK